MTTILALLAAAYKFFSPLARIGEKIVDARIAATNAQTEREKIAADERVQTLEARRDVMIAEAGAGIKLNARMRAFIALGPALYLNKIFIWDKVLKLGATDPLRDDNLWMVVLGVIGFYFMYEAVARFKR